VANHSKVFLSVGLWTHLTKKDAFARESVRAMASAKTTEAAESVLRLAVLLTDIMSKKILLKNINDLCTLANHSTRKRNISAGVKSMWNIRKYAAIAAVGTGLAVAAASSASAQCGGWGWGGGYGGWGGGYGAAGWGGYGGGCGGYGAGWGGGYGGWGGGYGAAGWGGYGGWGGGYGWGCRAHHHPHSYGGYALAYLPRHHQSGYAYAAYTTRHHRVAYAGSRHHRQLYEAGHGVRYSSNHTAKRHLASLKRSTRNG
jgi:hypothetical protein